MSRRLAAAAVIACACVPVAASQRAPAFDTTATFTCGTDEILRGPLPMTWSQVVLAGDSREYRPCPTGSHDETHREAREARLIQQASRAEDPVLRHFAAQALGRIGQGLPEFGIGTKTPAGVTFTRVPAPPPGTSPSLLGDLGRLLLDREPSVRVAAVRAFGEALKVRLADGPPAARNTVPVEWVRAHLREHATKERHVGVQAAVYETIGVIAHANDDVRNDTEQFLAAAAIGPSLKVLGAAKGLEAVIRSNPKRAITPAAVTRLRELARIGGGVAVPTVGGPATGPAPGDQDNWARTRRLAMLALQQGRDTDLETLTAAAADGDWQVRRIAAQRVDLANADLRALAPALIRDRDFQVRFEMLAAYARHAVKTGDCAEIQRLIDDDHPIVAMRAIDAVVGNCGGLNAILERLDVIASPLRTGHPDEWHLPVRAVNALARVAPARVRPFLEMAATHPIWQVRAAVAGVGATLSDADLVLRFADDANANVRTAALEALRRLQHPSLTDAALAALDSPDFQLVRTAASLLPVPAESDRDRVANALLAALRWLTAQGWDTSRDPRVAIIEKLARVLPPQRTSELLQFSGDVDDAVREAARAAYAKILETPNRPEAPVAARYPLQPTVEELSQLPTTAELTLREGVIRLELLIQDAPVTVARFAKLARAGHYDGLTFHRVVPNFVVQGGSPGANEYVGVARYMRDEVGLPHLRGSVGISTRGRDTGDAQIFIDLVDLPRLDHTYTVFARITSGFDVLDRILEGATIRTITVK